MSTTLTNGLKLPDKGSVDWYADMQSNYTILDGAVGTIAEHTSALSGKANAVHTHTKSDITDFPAYGNAAGTICEGNDSRLSDARTPVAHTHDKADITDLFNSANTWSDSNTFSKECIIYNSDNSGSVAVIKLRNSKAEILPTTNVNSEQDIIFSDKNDFQCARVRCGIYPAAVSNRILAATKDTNGNTVSTEIHIRAYRDGSKAVYPQSNSDVDLGTSTNKWKTLNGINPGALSLPRGGTTENVDYYNIATAIKPTGATSTNFSGSINYYQPTIDGWLSLVVTNCTDLSVWETTLKYGVVTTGITRNRQITMPVLANHKYEITIQGASWFSARLIPCQGNV